MEINFNLFRNIIKFCEFGRRAGEGWKQLLKKIVAKAKLMPSASADQISRAVLRSQPPHADDVPAMVAYNAKFGGLPNGIWINDLIHYCTLAKMPAEIHIPGRLFEAIAKLDFDTMMPGRAVTAILKRAAMSSKVTDGVVSDVRVSDITGLMSKDRKPLFLKADVIMEKCAKLLQDKKITDPQKTLDEGKLQCDLIDVVMGKTGKHADKSKQGKTIESDVTLESVTEKFIEGLFADDEVDIVDVGATPLPDVLTTVQYADDGQAINVGKMAMLKKGFKEGTYYTMKEPPSKDTTAKVRDPTIYKLESIAGDGTCTLKSFSDFGELSSESKIVDGPSFVARYRPFDKTFKFLKAYNGTEIKHQSSIKADLLNRRIQDAMMTLSDTMIDHDLTIRTSPSKGVFCISGPIEAMTLCPYGNVTKHDPTGKNHRNVEEHNAIKLQTPAGDIITHTMSQMPLSDDIQNAYWVVQATSDPDKANMAIVHEEVRFIMPSLTKLKISGCEYIVRIPCLKNLKALSKGDELLVFVAKKAAVQQEKRTKPLKLDLALPTKRSKAS